MNPAECEELPTALQLYGQLPNLYKIGDSKGILNLLQSCIGKDRLDILRFFFTVNRGIYCTYFPFPLFQCNFPPFSRRQVRFREKSGDFLDF